MNKNQLTIVLGGTRSGKSQFAEDLAQQIGKKVLYIATANVYDEEMAIRVKKHQNRRPEQWDTKEEPIYLKKVIEETSVDYDTILLDCLTLWLSNLILDENFTKSNISLKDKENYILNEVSRLADVCLQKKSNIIVVSNEVGLGVVPDYPLGRLFRDVAGAANQILAQRAQRVYFIAAGLPLTLKS